MDALAERLLERINERKVKRLRLFVDSVAGFRSAAVHPERMPRFFSALSHQLRMQDVTTLYSDETALFSAGVDMPQPDAAAYVENIIYLRYLELRSQLYRLISIMKMRESQYDSGIREFSITDEGINVADTFESAESILTGHARLRDDAPPEVAPPMDTQGKPIKRNGKSKKGGFLRRRGS
jgi:circadian clock protein KaiC